MKEQTKLPLSQLLWFWWHQKRTVYLTLFSFIFQSLVCNLSPFYVLVICWVITNSCWVKWLNLLDCCVFYWYVQLRYDRSWNFVKIFRDFLELTLDHHLLSFLSIVWLFSYLMDPHIIKRTQYQYQETKQIFPQAFFPTI